MDGDGWGWGGEGGLPNSENLGHFFAELTIISVNDQ